MSLLHDKGMNDVTVVLGGIIPEADIPALRKWASRNLSPPAPQPKTLSNSSTNVSPNRLSQIQASFLASVFAALVVFLLHTAVRFPGDRPGY